LPILAAHWHRMGRPPVFAVTDRTPENDQHGRWLNRPSPLPVQLSGPPRAATARSPPRSSGELPQTAAAKVAEVRMKRAWMPLLVAVFVLALVIPMAGQATSKITVTGADVSNGVVIVRVLHNGKDLELQCNQNLLSCTKLKKGDYTMVELPKNFGIYDCRDVEIYSEAPQPSKSNKLGEYCLIGNSQ
jgi:hypothetical protein